MPKDDNKTTEQNETFEKVIKIAEIIGEDEEKARKIINILIASYGIPREYFNL